jgi:hypothetical protein
MSSTRRPYGGSRHQEDQRDVSTILKIIFGKYRPTVRTGTASGLDPMEKQYDPPLPYFVMKGTTKKCESAQADAFSHPHAAAVL